MQRRILIASLFLVLGGTLLWAGQEAVMPHQHYRLTIAGAT